MEKRQEGFPNGSRRRWWGIGLLGVWALAIFITSCYVIRPEEFFRLVQQYLNLDINAMQEFRLFWGIWWFTIVKGWHFLEFAILTCLASWALAASGWLSLRGSIGVAMLLCILFAASDEWHQTFVPDRYGTVTDVLIDSMGVLGAGGLLYWRASRRALDENKAPGPPINGRPGAS